MATTEGPIGDLLFAESGAVAEVALTSAAARGVPLPRAIDLCIRTAYQVGIEIGVAIAVADVESGRRLRDWMARHVQGNDPRALEAREAQVARYLALLDREPSPQELLAPALALNLAPARRAQPQRQRRRVTLQRAQHRHAEQ